MVGGGAPLELELWRTLSNFFLVERVNLIILAVLFAFVIRDVLVFQNRASMYCFDSSICSIGVLQRFWSWLFYPSQK